MFGATRFCSQYTQQVTRGDQYITSKPPSHLQRTLMLSTSVRIISTRSLYADIGCTTSSIICVVTLIVGSGESLTPATGIKYLIQNRMEEDCVRIYTKERSPNRPSLMKMHACSNVPFIFVPVLGLRIKGYICEIQRLFSTKDICFLLIDGGADSLKIFGKFVNDEVLSPKNVRSAFPHCSRLQSIRRRAERTRQVRERCTYGRAPNYWASFFNKIHNADFQHNLSCEKIDT